MFSTHHRELSLQEEGHGLGPMALAGPNTVGPGPSPTRNHCVAVIGSGQEGVGSWDSSVAYQIHPWVWHVGSERFYFHQVC